MRRRILIVVYPGVQSLDVSGPAEVFTSAARSAGRPLYQVIVASIGGRRVHTSSGLELGTRELRHLRPGPHDTVLIAGGDEEGVRSAVADARLIAWIQTAHPRVQRLGSVCSGAFVLAQAGVLDGRRAATHWSSCDRLAQFRPQITVDRDAIFVHEGRLWTSAGITTGIDMALAMVEQDHDRKLADAIAARLVLYARRPGFQSQFSDVLVAQTDEGSPLGPAIAWGRAHLRALDVPRLAKVAGLSVRTLHRRCLDEAGATPAKLIERLRLEQARMLLTQGQRPVKRVAVECGFGSADRMRRAFERSFGMGPRAYRLLGGQGS